MKYTENARSLAYKIFILTRSQHITLFIVFWVYMIIDIIKKTFSFWSNTLRQAHELYKKSIKDI